MSNLIKLILNELYLIEHEIITILVSYKIDSSITKTDWASNFGQLTKGKFLTVLWHAEQLFK
jgi:hypothetical protein